MTNDDIKKYIRCISKATVGSKVECLTYKYRDDRGIHFMTRRHVNKLFYSKYLFPVIDLFKREYRFKNGQSIFYMCPILGAHNDILKDFYPSNRYSEYNYIYSANYDDVIITKIIFS